MKIEKDVINAQDVDGYTALHFAAYNCVSAEIIRLLVLAGARVSLSDRRVCSIFLICTHGLPFICSSFSFSSRCFFTKTMVVLDGYG